MVVVADTFFHKMRETFYKTMKGVVRSVNLSSPEWLIIYQKITENREYQRG